jgi:hypothetical protein
VSIDDGETGESEDEESHLNVGACTVTGKTWLHTPFCLNSNITMARD